MKNILKKMFDGWDASNTIIVLMMVVVMGTLLAGLCVQQQITTQKIQACKEISKNVAEFKDCLE